MRFRTAIILATIFWLVPCTLLGQSPSLTLVDSGGTTYWAPDNTTLFEAVPGELFSLEIEGEAHALFGLYLSLFKTPYPMNVTPPPLLLMPPLFPVVAGPAMLLDYQGQYAISLFVPKELSTLGYDLDLYVQAFVSGASSGFALTNGATLRILSPQYKARIALARGEALNSIVEFGEVADGDAGDNQLPAGGGPGLENGEPIAPDGDMTPGHQYAFIDDSPPPAGTPDPTTSIYLNGIFPLVPGDSGVDDRLRVYPKMGSHLHIYTRDRVCRNAENMNLQHIIIPSFDGDGNKTSDLNLYHFRDRTTGEYGFMMLDVLTNDFYELKGTRLPGVNNESPWDPNVGVSPDGLLMAAVWKDRPGTDVTKWKDKLFVIKLRKADTWSTGDHARKVKINELTNDHWANRIFPETLTFAGDPDPHGLFFVTNRFDSKTGNKDTEPPPDIASSLWSLQAAGENSKVKYHNFTSAGSPYPKTSNSLYSFIYFGRPKFISALTKEPTELKWLRSEDNRTICMRAAGRFAQYQRGWDTGDWSWEILAITDVELGGGSFTYEIKNITGFPEHYPEKGFHIDPLGHAYNGWAKAAISPPDTSGSVLIAFTTTRYDANTYSENLYVAPVDGTLSGQLAPVNNVNVFKGLFQYDDIFKIGAGFFDPYFLSPDTLVFFCGRNARINNNFLIYPEGDLFLYLYNEGEFRNLTQTAREPWLPFTKVKEPVPPFTLYGTMRPCGLFSSRDRRFLFFFRAAHNTIYQEPKHVNLVGVDTAMDYNVFDLTGDEFSGGFIADTDLEFDDDVYWGPERMNMILVPAENTDILYYTAKWFYWTAPENFSYQAFMVNTSYPIAAFPITSFDYTDEPGLIDNLVADATGNFIAFSRSNDVKYDGTEGAWEDLYAVDLSLGAFTHKLTADYPDHTRASIDGSFRFLPAASPKIPAVLIYGMGLGGTAAQADNPNQARIWLYPLFDLMDPQIPSFPLTVENQFLLFHAQPDTTD